MSAGLHEKTARVHLCDSEVNGLSVCVAGNESSKRRLAVGSCAVMPFLKEHNHCDGFMVSCQQTSDVTSSCEARSELRQFTPSQTDSPWSSL